MTPWVNDCNFGGLCDQRGPNDPEVPDEDQREPNELTAYVCKAEEPDHDDWEGEQITSGISTTVPTFTEAMGAGTGRQLSTIGSFFVTRPLVATARIT